MRATQQMLAKGFFGRSLDEFKRLSMIGIEASLLLNDLLANHISSIDCRNHTSTNETIRASLIP